MYSLKPTLVTFGAAALVLLSMGAFPGVFGAAVKNAEVQTRAVQTQAQAKDFVSSCVSWSGRWKTGTTGRGVAVLTARCKKDDGSLKDSELDLGRCYWNDQGVTYHKKDGWFTESCELTGDEYPSSPENHWLSVSCQAPGGFKVWSSIDINFSVGVKNGDLVC